MANKIIPKKYIFPTHIYKYNDEQQKVRSKRSEDGSVYRMVTDGFSNEAVLRDRVNLARNRYYQESSKMLKESLGILKDLDNKGMTKLVKNYEDLMVNTYDEIIAESNANNALDDPANQFYESYIKNNIGTYDEFNKYIEGLNEFRSELGKYLEQFNKPGAIIDINKLQQIVTIERHIKKMQKQRDSGQKFSNKELKNKMIGGFNAVIKGATGELKDFITISMSKKLSNTSITGGQSGQTEIKGNKYTIGQVKPDVTGYYEYVKSDGTKFTFQAGFSVKHYLEHRGKNSMVSGATIHLVKGAKIKRFIDRLNNAQYCAALNILANEPENGKHDLFASLGNFLAASFVDEFLTGSYGRINGTDMVDIAQVLIYNNKAYPMSSILDALADSQKNNISKLATGGYKVEPLTGTLSREVNIKDKDFNLYKLNEKDKSKRFDPDGYLAGSRSKETGTSLLNSTTIRVTLKSSAFKNIAKSAKPCCDINEFIRIAQEIDKDLKI